MGWRKVEDKNQRLGIITKGVKLNFEGNANVGYLEIYKRNPDYHYEIINSANYLLKKFAGFIKNFRI